MEDYKTNFGKIVPKDSLEYMRDSLTDESLDLIFTSPPFALLRKKDYGNVAEDEYVAWFEQFAHEFFRLLKPTGSLVIDIGGSWIPGQPSGIVNKMILTLIPHDFPLVYQRCLFGC